MFYNLKYTQKFETFKNNLYIFKFYVIMLYMNDIFHKF